MHSASPNWHSLLLEVAEAGGKLERLEGTFSALETEGLVDVEIAAGDTGFTEIATLTNLGRKALGLPVVTPDVNIPWQTRLLSRLGIGKPRLG